MSVADEVGEQTVSDPGTSGDIASQTSEPVIQVVKGNPSDEELAALVTVFAGLTNGTSSADLEPHERDLWGHPVDNLRYSVFSWQRVTQVERMHMRR